MKAYSDDVAISELWPAGDVGAPAELLFRVLYQVGRYATYRHITNAPFTVALHERLGRPQPGDWVVETTKFMFGEDCVGMFVTRMWDMEHPDGEKQDPCNYLWRVRAAISGRFHNWGNAKFRALPTTGVQHAVHNTLDERAKTPVWPFTVKGGACNI